MSKATQDYIGRFAGNSVRYFPALAHSLGSVNAALMLSQLVYWESMGHRHDGYFYKTAVEMYYETGLSDDKQATARKLLVKKGLIETKVAGIPAKTHYRVNTSEITSLLTTWREEASAEVKKALFKFPEKQVTITKTTQHTTHKPATKDNYQNLPQQMMDVESRYSSTDSHEDDWLLPIDDESF